MFKQLTCGALALLCAAVVVTAQTLPASPEGKAQAQFKGSYVKAANGEMQYEGGKWVEITYGRPILRGRTNISGSGADYGKVIKDDAPVWRAGTNASTRIRTELPLGFGANVLKPGEYSVFIDLKAGAWTLVFSNWPAQKVYDAANKAALWGSYGYTADKDEFRVPMTMTKNAMSVEQLTWAFVNVTDKGGELAIMWDKEIATVKFGLLF